MSILVKTHRCGNNFPSNHQRDSSPSLSDHTSQPLQSEILTKPRAKQDHHPRATPKTPPAPARNSMKKKKVKSQWATTHRHRKPTKPQRINVAEN